MAYRWCLAAVLSTAVVADAAADCYELRPVFSQIAKPTVAGEMDPVIVQRYLKRVRPALDTCYEDERVDHPTRRAAVTATFSVGADGNARDANVVGLGNAKIEACLRTVIESIRFARGPFVSANVTASITLFEPPASVARSLDGKPLDVLTWFRLAPATDFLPKTTRTIPPQCRFALMTLDERVPLQKQ